MNKSNLNGPNWIKYKKGGPNRENRPEQEHGGPNKNEQTNVDKIEQTRPNWTKQDRS